MRPRTLLAEFASSFERKWALPRNELEVSRELGVSVVRGIPKSVSPHDAKDGLFTPRPKPTIYIASTREKLGVRERFTWAHELGHFLIWDAMRLFPGADYWEHETACDWFAGEFLIPRYIAAQVAGQPNKHWLDKVDELRGICNVSWAVTACALTSLSQGKIVFLQISYNKSGVGKVLTSSTKHHCGVAYGSRANIADSSVLDVMDRLSIGQSELVIAKEDIGQLQLSDCPFLIRRRPKDFVAMARLTQPLPSILTGENELVPASNP